MCTAVTFFNQDFYFGRTLDLEHVYGEEVVITPRRYPIKFRHRRSMDDHYAVIGVAHVVDGYPLYYDAVNEYGLCMAGLNFPGFARYGLVKPDKENVTSFEFIPYVLMSCKCMKDVRNLLGTMQLTQVSFKQDYPCTPLHWLIADKTQCITVESMADGIHIYDNPVGILTNNPPFDDQMFQLRNYMHLSPYPPENHFSAEVDLKPYSRGMGAIGLPGDLSSQSRFVRAAFMKLNSMCTVESCVSQYFHILDSVYQTRGSSRLENGKCEITQYSSCYNASKGICFYTTYNNRRITAVDMHREELQGNNLIHFPLYWDEDVLFLNR